MELSKQLKVIDRKFAYNTGKLPGFSGGLAAEKLAGYPTNSPIYKTLPSPYQMMTEQKVLNDWLNSLKTADSEILAWRDSQKAPQPEFRSEVDRMRSYLKPGESLIGSNLDNKIQKGSGYVSDDPYVKNPNLKAPDTADKIGKFADSQRISAGISGGLSLGDAAFKAFKDYQTLDEQLAEMRTVNRKVMGIDTPMLQEAKNGKLPGFSNGLSNILEGTGGGAMLGGSIVPGWGHVIGGLAGAAITGIGELVSEGRHNEIKKSKNNIVTSINNASHNSSVGIAQRILNLQTYGDQYSQPLHAANGKLPGCNNGNLPPYAFTEHGLVLGLEPNAMGASGETMSDGNGNDFVLPGTPSNNDTLPIYASGKTTIVTNKKGLSKYYQQTGDLDGVQAAMAYYKQHGYKNGKMPGCAEGWLGNAIPAFLGGIAGLGQTISAYNNRPYRPNTYVGNPYEGSALTTLAGLRINPYPIMSQLRNAEARTNRAIDIAGGLSGGLRTAARLAALNTTQGNISKLLSDIQQLNNAYRANYAQAAINAGQLARTARMAANQWDLDYYSKAHAARNRGIQTGIANMLAQIQQYQANEFKRRQFNDTMQLYRDDMDQRKKNFEWYQNNALNVNNNPDPTKNPGAQYFNLMSPYEKWMLLQNRGIIR